MRVSNVTRVVIHRRYSRCVNDAGRPASKGGDLIIVRKVSTGPESTRERISFHQQKSNRVHLQW